MKIARRAFLATIGGGLLAPPTDRACAANPPWWRVAVLLVLLSPAGKSSRTAKRLQGAGVRSEIVKRAMKARLPVISGEKPYTEEGALTSYGPTGYVDTIASGPGDRVTR